MEAKIETQLQMQLPEVRGATCLGMSALTGQGLEGVLPAVVQSYGVWNQRIPTGRLNKWLVKVFYLTLIFYQVLVSELLSFPTQPNPYPTTHKFMLSKDPTHPPYVLVNSHSAKKWHLLSGIDSQRPYSDFCCQYCHLIFGSSG